jgi:uncharacterized protein
MKLEEQPIVITTHMLQESHNFQCDCACVTDSGASIEPVGLRSELLKRADVRVQDLPKGFKLLFNYHEGNGVAVVNQSAFELWQGFDKPRQCLPEEFEWASLLLETGALLPDKKSGKYGMKSRPNTLSAWLHLTDRCNLRCTYCYLPHIKSTMSYDVGKQVVDSVFRSAKIHNFSGVLLKYAGGEPLLSLQLLKKIHQYAEISALQKEIVLESVVLSNGTLLSQAAVDFLKNHKIRLMISLDGLGAAHDRQRVYAGGKGTFLDVIRAIEIAQNNDLIPEISITITGSNSVDLPELVQWILDRQLPFSLNFYRECDLSASHKELILEEEKVIKGVLATYKVIEEYLPRQSLLGALMDRANLTQPHQHTCGVGLNYLVFDPQGQVSKCQMDQERPITSSNEHDPLQIVLLDQVGIQNVSVDTKTGCSTCDWRYSCAGGCPLVTFRATGRFDLKSPNCHIYQRLFPEVLRLEGLRLLKYGSSQ